MAAPSNRYLGKFRGRVVSNDDPLRLGRITAEVPDVLGDEPSTWALPCLPFTGSESGQLVPAARGGLDGVRTGDPSFPVWTGCWYGDASELPPDARRELRARGEQTRRRPDPGRPQDSPQRHGRHRPGDPPAGPRRRLHPHHQEAVVIATGAGAEITLRGREVTINQGQLTAQSQR
ncbi:phage baseplate assembly protein V [Streptomyces nogalater]